jgi:quercetin dioxygenase-like cupin family protein
VQKTLNIPGVRNNWHSHKGGQVLLIISGSGWYQEEGNAARSLQAGDIVMIPENVKHWHGVTMDSWITHIYIVTNPQKGACEWF